MFVGDIGRAALFLSMFVVPYVFLASTFGVVTKNKRLQASAKMAVVLQFVLVAIASGALIELLVSLNFRYTYVAEYTSRGLEVLYRIAAFWGGDAGSLLFWLLIMSVYLLVVRFTTHEGSEQMHPVVTAIMAFVMTFFAIVINTVANPFDTLPYTPQNGNGLNALLQNPGMTVHPVNLYLGYIGFLIPFAYAMAALILKRTDATWLRVTRRWTLISWLFLSCGIIYGAHWSYEELGWGGYWSWDPIENAALMPWLAATAFLHSAMIQERKGMLKAWNVILISLTFLLTLFGTALTRGGMLWSIHSFANGPMGTLFMSFVGIMLVFSAAIIFWRFSYLKADTKFEAIVSKETGFLLNNVLFIGALFAVFWGTVFPLVTEAVTGTQMMVSAPFYNTVVLPIGVALILLMAIGPVVAWRKSSLENLGKFLLAPASMALIIMLIIFFLGYRNPLSLASYFASSFVVWTILSEFWRGVNARMRMTGEAAVISLVRMIGKNRRRYGGYIVHLAVIVMVIGFASTGGYSQQVTINLKPGASVSIGDYVLLYHGLRTSQKPGQVVLSADLVVYTAQGNSIGVLQPAVTFYENGQSPSSDMALYSTPWTDLYVVLDGTDNQTGQALFEVHLNPLVSFIWAGGYLYIVGTFVSLWPEKKRQDKAKRQVIKNAL